MKPRSILVDQDETYAPMTGLGVRFDGHDHQVGEGAVGNKSLLSIDYVSVFIFYRPSADSGQIGAGVGFSESDGRHHFTGGTPGQPTVLDLGRAKE